MLKEIDTVFMVGSIWDKKRFTDQVHEALEKLGEEGKVVGNLGCIMHLTVCSENIDTPIIEFLRDREPCIQEAIKEVYGDILPLQKVKVDKYYGEKEECEIRLNFFLKQGK